MSDSRSDIREISESNIEDVIHASESVEIFVLPDGNSVRVLITQSSTCVREQESVCWEYLVFSSQMTTWFGQ